MTTLTILELADQYAKDYFMGRPEDARKRLQAAIMNTETVAHRRLVTFANLARDLNELVDVPGPNCSCHISPPCGDCVDHSWTRELKRNADDELKNLAAEGWFSKWPGA